MTIDIEFFLVENGVKAAILTSFALFRLGKSMTSSLRYFLMFFPRSHP